MSRLITETLEPDAVGQQIVDIVQQLAKAKTAVLYRLDPVSGDLHLLAGTGPQVNWNRALPRGSATVELAIRDVSRSRPPIS